MTRTSWRAILEHVARDVTESGADQLSCTCPFCHHHRISFYIHARRGLWTCKYCGRHGRGEQLVKALRRLGLISDVLAPATPDEDDDDEPSRQSDAIKLPDEFERLRLPVGTGNRRFWNYAARRHLTPELVQTYNIGFCRTGRYAGRLIVPVVHNSQLVSFVARDITDVQPMKILSPSGNRQSQYLFNLDRVRHSIDRVVVVEGVFDCFVLPDRAVASLGKRLTNAQVLLLAEAGFRSVSLAWDADARREAEDAASRLALFVDTHVVSLAEGDPSKLGRDVMLRAIAQAEPSTPARRVRAWV